MNFKITTNEIARYIDHTNVKPDATTADIKKLCQETVKYSFHSVCVTPYRVKDARRFLDEIASALPRNNSAPAFTLRERNKRSVELICVVGFPFGLTTIEVKVFEAKQAVENGATEIDMVINIGAVKDGNWKYVKNEISKIAKAIKPIGLKVIMEPGFLTHSELVKSCQIAKKAGAAFVKTSTGYGPQGATVENIKLMRQTVGPKMGVKASGEIHNFKTAITMIKVGANRIGTSSGLEIIGIKNHESRIRLLNKNQGKNYKLQEKKELNNE